MERAEARKEERGYINAGIARAVAPLLRSDEIPEGIRLGPDEEIDVSRISRCLTGKVAPMHLLEAISLVLRIPAPFYIPRTEAEAREMNSTRSSYDTATRKGLAEAMEIIDAQPNREVLAVGERELSEIEAGVPKLAKRRQSSLIKRSGADVENAKDRRPGGGVGGGGKRPTTR
jgi:hypothetical protein